ncbi:MAG TPA: hypothetical protein VN645_13485 [Steroidobacteraceae bacterium]|nr:hypothetical protein [Steroidobacteraceae bacterium]
MERLLLLWDELDELMGYGRHLAVGFSQAVIDGSRRWRGGTMTAHLPGVRSGAQLPLADNNPLN